MDRYAIQRLANAAGRQDRRKAERFIKRASCFRKGARFSTGNGHRHTIIKTDEQNLYISSKRYPYIKLPKKNLCKVLAYWFQVRIIQRIDMEAFFSYSSILFGLLAQAVSGKSILIKARNVLRLIKKATRIYLAGGDRSPRDLSIAKQTGVRHVLFSYYHIRNGTAWRRYVKEIGLRCILDSGAFSAWKAVKQGKAIKPISVDDYMDFIEANLDIIDHYFVLDEVENWEKTQRNLRLMEARGLSPIPIYHMGEPIEILDQYVTEEYPVIGLGGTVDRAQREEFLEMVFNRHPGVAFHGLGITKASLLLKHPFYSCDSTAWLQARKKEILLTPQGQCSSNLHWIERMKKSVKFLRALDSVKYKQKFYSREWGKWTNASQMKK